MGETVQNWSHAAPVFASALLSVNTPVPAFLTSTAGVNDPLRYGTTPTEGTAGELGFLRLRWKAPGVDTSTLVETPITGTEVATNETRFAAAIAGFGQLLQGSVYTGAWGWDQAIESALSARGEDPYGYRIEAVNLMRLAQSLDLE